MTHENLHTFFIKDDRCFLDSFEVRNVAGLQLEGYLHPKGEQLLHIRVWVESESGPKALEKIQRRIYQETMEALEFTTHKEVGE